MLDGEKPDFTKAMAALIVLYPNFTPEKTLITAYWDRLRQYSWPAVRKALTGALTHSPQFFPTCGVLMELAANYDKAAKPYVPPGDYAALPPRPEPEGSGTAAGEALATKWQQESREMGQHPDRPVSLEVARQRFAELNDLLGGKLK